MMKKRIKILFLLTLLCSMVAISQTKTTKETKVIAVVLENKIEAIEHFEQYKTQKEVLLKKYPKASFFIGLLKGKYEVKEGVVIPKNEATITVFTEKQIFHKTGLFTNKKPAAGDALAIGKTKARVVSAKNGELILRTNNK